MGMGENPDAPEDRRPDPPPPPPTRRATDAFVAPFPWKLALATVAVWMAAIVTEVGLWN
jgi:hypothetical protein